MATDLTIEVGESFGGKHYGTLQAHRAFLMAASPYFEEIIADGACGAGKFYDHMNVPDMTISNFTTLLR